MIGGPRLGGAALVIAVVLMVSGCGDDASESARPEPARSALELPDPDEHFHEVAPPTASVEQLDPAASAEAVLRTWSRPELAYDTWWAELVPLLSAQGRQDYAETDPAVVPRVKITGAAVVEASSVDTAAVVWLPTDQGRFGIRLSRTSAESPWLASRILFPES